MLDRRDCSEEAASAIRLGHEPDLIARSQEKPAGASRQRRRGQLAAGHVHELAFDWQLPQTAPGRNPDLLFLCRDRRSETRAGQSVAGVSAAHRASLRQCTLVVQLILDPGTLLLALVDAKKIEDILLIAGAHARPAMRGRRFDILHPSQRRAILAQQDDRPAAHSSHSIPGGRHALDPTSQRQ